VTAAHTVSVEARLRDVQSITDASLSRFEDLLAELLEPRGRGTRMPEARFPVEMVSSVPVVVTPEEIDITNAAGLRAALLEAAAHGPGIFVVDMSRTQFCDTAGIHALVGAHKRAEAGHGEIRLVITGAAVLRIFAITGLDSVIPHFASLEEALAATPGSTESS
jgi:anti-sigma B factor antagonist